MRSILKVREEVQAVFESLKVTSRPHLVRITGQMRPLSIVLQSSSSPAPDPVTPLCMRGRLLRTQSNGRRRLSR